jgi:hypothetical protein
MHVMEWTFSGYWKILEFGYGLHGELWEGWSDHQGSFSGSIVSYGDIEDPHWLWCVFIYMRARPRSAFNQAYVSSELLESAS